MFFFYMHQIGFVDLTGGVVDSAMLCVGEERGRWQYDAYAPGDDVDLIAVETADGFRVSYSYDVGGNSVEGFFELPTD